MAQIYDWQRKKWPEFWNHDITTKEQRMILRKLARHFKTTLPVIHDTLRVPDRGRYYPGLRLVQVAKITRLGVLCHEFAHHLQNCRLGYTRHDKVFRRELSKVMTFAKRYLPQTIVQLENCGILEMEL